MAGPHGGKLGFGVLPMRAGSERFRDAILGVLSKALPARLTPK